MSQMMKIAILLTFISSLMFGLTITSDYTLMVNNSERLSKVFNGKDVSNSNLFQGAFIIICGKLESCGA